jgi:hypothetical protein
MDLKRNRIGGQRLDHFGSGKGQVVACCEHGTKSLGFIKQGIFRPAELALHVVRR